LKVQFLETAKAEFREAVRYYNQQREGLGREFAAEVRKATQRIAKLPNAWPPISDNARRFLLRRFPYGIIYLVEDKTVFIVAVMHLARDPVVWQERLKPIDRS
jgi:plasmid stabilization system protein ParE